MWNVTRVGTLRVAGQQFTVGLIPWLHEQRAVLVRPLYTIEGGSRCTKLLPRTNYNDLSTATFNAIDDIVQEQWGAAVKLAAPREVDEMRRMHASARVWQLVVEENLTPRQCCAHQATPSSHTRNVLPATAWGTLMIEKRRLGVTLVQWSGGQVVLPTTPYHTVENGQRLARIIDWPDWPCGQQSYRDQLLESVWGPCLARLTSKKQLEVAAHCRVGMDVGLAPTCFLLRLPYHP